MMSSLISEQWNAQLFRLFILFFSLFVVSSAYSAQRVDVYTTEVPVESQAEGVRKKAFRRALSQVLVNITGTIEYEANSDVQQLLSRAGKYVLGFGYRDNPSYRMTVQAEMEAQADDSSQEDETAQEADVYKPKPYLLQVQFSEEGLSNPLRSLNVPLWGALRPSILAWVMLERSNDRSLAECPHRNRRWVEPGACRGA